MKTNKELVEHLNSLKILQTSSWDENIPQEIWDEYFKDIHEVVETGLDVDKHRWYELSTTVIEINNGFIGICSVTDCFSEQSSIEDMYHHLKFFEVKKINQPTYIKMPQEQNLNEPEKLQLNIDAVICSVVHCKQAPYDVYIGRPSIWGNPFTHLKDGKTLAKYIVGSRDEAVEAYREWITKGDGKHLMKDLPELKNKVLGCWCSPQSCHGDVLSELVSKHCI